MAVVALSTTPPPPTPTPYHKISKFLSKPTSTPVLTHHETPLSKTLHTSSKPPSTLQTLSSLCKSGHLRQALDLLHQIETLNFPIGCDLYSEFLQGCVLARNFHLGRQIHALIIKKGESFSCNEYIETKLVIFYSKCDELESAGRVFGGIGSRNVFSWAALIGLYSRLGLNEKSLGMYCDMIKEGVLPDNFIVPNVLKACGGCGSIGFGRGVHGCVVKLGIVGCVFVGCSLVDMYGKCGALGDAEKVFDAMPERNVVAWNSLIVGYVQNGLWWEAMRVFYDMRVEGEVEPSRVSLSSLVSASGNLRAVAEGRQGHGMSVVLGLDLDRILGSSMLSFYSKVGLVEDCETVFMRMVDRDVVTWNLLVSCYVQHGLYENALAACWGMRAEDMRFDCVTLTSLLSAAANTGNLRLGKEGHCFCIRNCFDSEVAVVTSIVDMYAKCERIMCARQTLDISLHKDLVLWNTLLAAYGKLGMSGEAMKLFYQIHFAGLTPDVVSYNSVILALLQHEQVNEAKDMFSQMQANNVEPNLITWTTLISGLVQNGLFLEAVTFFRKMQECGMKPNSAAIISVFSAFMNETFLQHGKETHGYAMRQGFFSYSEVVTSLEQMYTRCDRIDRA